MATAPDRLAWSGPRSGSPRQVGGSARSTIRRSTEGRSAFLLPEFGGIPQLLRYLLFFCVLLKFTGLGLWPHTYNGESYDAPRWRYYSEMAITMLSLVTLAVHAGFLPALFRKNILVVSYTVVAALYPALVLGRTSLSDASYGLNYIELLAAPMLIVYFDGPGMALRLSVYFGAFFVSMNALSALQPSRSMMYGLMVAFRGLTPHRNDLSWYSLYFLFSALCIRTECRRPIRNFTIAGSAVLILAAGSVQGILLSIFGVSLLAAIRSRSSLPKNLIVAALLALPIAVVAGSLLSEYINDILQFFGRDLTFTGRDRIWALSLYRIHDMPWYGYGHGSLSSSRLPLDILELNGLGTIFGTAHSSYLESILSYGWLLGGSFVVIVSIMVLRTIRMIRSRSEKYVDIGATLVLFCSIGGFTASEKLFLPTFGWFSFCLGTMYIGYASVRQVGGVTKAPDRKTRTSPYGRGAQPFGQARA